MSSSNASSPQMSGAGAGLRKPVLFISWRMGECKEEVKGEAGLQNALEAEGVDVLVVGEHAGGDLLEAVSNGMERADLFVIMGTKTYGKKTSDLIDTFREMQRIKSSGKPFFLINMNPEESLMRFEQEAANLLLNLDTTAWERWEVGAKLPNKLVQNILAKLAEAVGKTTGTKPT